MKYYKSRKSTASRIVAGFVGFAMALSMAGVAGTAGAATTEELQKQIADLLALVTALQGQLSGVSGGGTTASVCPYTWSTNLKVGSTGADVMSLQKFLNATAGTALAGTGAGSSGKETSTFGPATKAAVVKFQNMYAADVLTPVGLTAGTGFVGAGTRAKLNMLCASAPTPTPVPPGTPTPVPPGTPVPPPAVGTGLSVSAAPVQPANSLAPGGAARIPFTNIVFTAGNDGDVTVNSVVVQRVGAGSDSNFSGVVLLDEHGMQIGLDKTLNSEHHVTLNEPFVVAKGMSRTLTVAGTMKAAGSLNAGELLSLQVVAVNTTATVSGTLPIKGATHTVNTALTLGIMTVDKGPLDQNAATTKDIGVAGVVFNSIKAAAGSAEDIRLLGMRYNQTGSAGKADLANVKAYVDGVGYDTTLDSTGKYYTVMFGSGIVIKKGQFKEVTVKGDIKDGSARTIIFDVFKSADMYFQGETYGYGITPAAGTTAAVSTTSSDFTTGSPFYDEATMTIAGGSLTVGKSIAVQSQNVAENVSGLDLGAWDIESKGEPISVSQMDFYFDIVSSEANMADLTGVTLRDANGGIVAGPVDGSNTTGAKRVRFTDSVTFPVGKNVYYLKGKYGTDFNNNDTVTASTTPGTDFATVRGTVSGNTITATPSSVVGGNAMTVKAPEIRLSVAGVPTAQTVVAGSLFTFANYQLDASNSGDDIQFNSLLLDWDAVAGTPSNLSGCSLFDGATELNTGSNRINSSNATFTDGTGNSDDNVNFTFDKALVIPKGTVKSLALKCNTSATTTTHQYRWGLGTLSTAANSAIGVNSGQSMTTNATGLYVNGGNVANTGQTITLTTGGTYTVADDSTPGYSIVSAGNEVTLLKLRFSANNEDVDVKKVAFELGSVASNTPLDLVGQKVTLWDGTTQVGEAIFVSNGDFATSTLTGQFRVPANGSKTMAVKGTISTISQNSGPLTRSGDLLVVKWDGNDVNSTTPVNSGNYAKGVSGGTNISPTSPSDITPTGVRIMKSYPTLAKIDLSSTERLLQTGADRVLYKFSVKANNGDVGLYKFTFETSSSTANDLGVATTTMTKYSLYSYLDSAFASADSSFSSNGLLNASQCYGSESGSSAGGNIGQGTIANSVSIVGSGTGVEIFMDKSQTACAGTGIATTTYTVPSGQTRYFILKADLGTVETVGAKSQSMDVKLRGDAAFPATLIYPSTGGKRNSGTGDGTGAVETLHRAVIADSDTNNDFIWSPNSTTTSIGLTDSDWTNGFQIPGLPASDMSAETLISAN